MEYIKAGNIELTIEEATKIYNEKKFICSFTGIYQPRYNDKLHRLYFTKVLNIKNYARRGRFYTQTAKQINIVLEGDFIKEY